MSIRRERGRAIAFDTIKPRLFCPIKCQLPAQDAKPRGETRASVMKQHQQDDDRQRHTQHPEKKTSSHVNTPPKRIADENTCC
jgi:hypothetical protein